jgi:hypothetical protein
LLVDHRAVDYDDQCIEAPTGNQRFAIEVEKIEEEVADPLAPDLALFKRIADAPVLGANAVPDALRLIINRKTRLRDCRFDDL